VSLGHGEGSRKDCSTRSKGQGLMQLFQMVVPHEKGDGGHQGCSISRKKKDWPADSRQGGLEGGGAIKSHTRGVVGAGERVQRKGVLSSINALSSRLSSIKIMGAMQEVGVQQMAQSEQDQGGGTENFLVNVGVR